MSKTNSTKALVLIIMGVFLSGCFALAKPEESSGAVSAPTLAPVEQPTLAEPAEAESVDPSPELVEGYPGAESAPPLTAPETAEPYPGGEPAPQPVPVVPPADYPGAEGLAADIVGGAALYEIDPARSEARFTINEVLRGAPKTVVGITNNLGGQISFDLDNPAAAQVGPILIDARDIRTDDDFRNRAIANQILQTNDFEFITFEPTAISGLPESVVIGETYSLQMTGNLTIKDQTREVTFDVAVTPVSESELQGLATLDINYADFGVVVPFARAVESVEDHVLLELEFMALAQ